jgi:hypothetical protein
MGIAPDFLAEEHNKPALSIAWNHRKLNDADVYFISNQKQQKRWVSVSLRVSGKKPEIWDPVSGRTKDIRSWDTAGNRTAFELTLNAGEALFVVFSREGIPPPEYIPHISSPFADTLTIHGDWQIRFDTAFGGPVKLLQTSALTSWTQSSNDSIKYYSGTAMYRNSFKVSRKALKAGKAFLVIDSLYNIADITINGKPCGTIWTIPYTLDIGGMLKGRKNTIGIAVTNTWHNRLIGDQLLPAYQRRTWTTAPFRLQGKPLEPAGITGGVYILTYR